MTRTSNTQRMMLGLGCLAAIALATPLQAQTREAPAERQQQMGMMAQCQKMMADTKAGEAKLDDLVARMNAATGQLKIDQMAAVLTELVAQRKMMHAHMAMMGHEAASSTAAPEQPSAPHEQHH